MPPPQASLQQQQQQQRTCARAGALVMLLLVCAAGAFAPRAEARGSSGGGGRGGGLSTGTGGRTGSGTSTATGGGNMIYSNPRTMYGTSYGRSSLAPVAAVSFVALGYVYLGGGGFGYHSMRMAYNDGCTYDDCVVRNVTAAAAGLPDHELDLAALQAAPDLLAEQGMENATIQIYNETLVNTYGMAIDASNCNTTTYEVCRDGGAAGGFGAGDVRRAALAAVALGALLAVALASGGLLL